MNLKSIPIFGRYFYYYLAFSKFIGHRALVLAGFSFIGTITEGLGITCFVTYVQYLAGNRNSASQIVYTMQRLFEKYSIPFQPIYVVALIILIFSLRGIFVFIGKSYHFKIHTDLIGKSMRELASSMSRMGYLEYLKYSSGHFVHLATKEMNKFVMAYYQVSILIPMSISVITYIALSLKMDWRFTILAGFFGGSTVFLFRTVNRKTASFSKILSREESRLSSLIVQMMQSFKYLYSTASLYPLNARVDKSSRVVASSAANIGFLAAILPSASETIIVAFMGSMILLQIEVFKGSIDSLLIAMLFLYRAMKELNVMQGSWQTFNAYIGGVDAIIDSINTFNQSAETPGGKKISGIYQGFQFESVSFSYGQKQILHNVSLSIPHNSMVAFVGESGAGKSTVVDLLTGLMFPGSGKILVDGVDYKDLDRNYLRKLTGYVTQESVMFDDTVANNISLWRWENEPSGEKKVREALERANCSSFINNLPHGLDEMLGERGIRLSGGQRQRMTIARELYKSPALLVLDEATSALDSESEKVVQESIDRLKGSTTIVIIAHRLSTVKNCDIIYVMNAGKVVSSGTFDELTKNCNIFKRMAAAQGLINI